MNRRLSSCLFVAFLLLFVDASSAQQSSQSGSAKSHEELQTCLGALWDKPIFWDRSAVASVDLSVCTAKSHDAEQALKQQHILAFRLPNAVLLTSETKFDKNSAPFNYLWTTPSINIRVLPRVSDFARRQKAAIRDEPQGWH